MFEYEDEIFDKDEYEKYIKTIQNKIKDESLDIHLIFRVLNRIELDYKTSKKKHFYIVDKKHFYIFIQYLIFIINI